MNWASIVLLAIGLVTVFVLYRSGQTSTVVPVEHRAATAQGEMEAIEYYWRPG